MRHNARFMRRHEHYATGTYVPSVSARVPEREYAQALDILVKGVVDILLTDVTKTRVILGLRRHEPAKGKWWLIGGRMRCGETVEETAKRHVKRDIGVEIDVTRFSFVCSSTMTWEFRVQEPVGNGTCDLGVVMTAQLTEEEIAKWSMCELEYVEQKFWNVKDVVADETLPSPVRDGARKMLFCEREDALFKAVKANKCDTEIAELARVAFNDGKSSDEMPICYCVNHFSRFHGMRD